MKAEITAKNWEFFDKIYCISLNERADRREEAKRQFGKIGLLERVEFEIVEKHPHNIEQGIFESHLGCLEKGIRAGADAIAVFEAERRVLRQRSVVKLERRSGVIEMLDGSVLLSSRGIKQRQMSLAESPSERVLPHHTDRSAFGHQRAERQRLSMRPVYWIAVSEYTNASVQKTLQLRVDSESLRYPQQLLV